MEFTLVSNLIQKVQQMQIVSTDDSQLSSPIIAQTLKYLLDLKEIIQRKLIDQNAVVTNDLGKKVKGTQKKIEENYHNLRRTQEFHEEKLKFKDEIILRNCSLIIQRQCKHYKLMEKEKIIFEQKTASHQQILENQMKQINDEIIAVLEQKLQQNRTRNMLKEKDERKEWDKRKEKLNDVLSEYDMKMFDQEQVLELIKETLKKEEIKLIHFKAAYTAQTEVYKALMAEKEEYLEQQRQNKLEEIRMKIARRTISKFIENHYAAWKKKKLKAAKKKVKCKYNLNMSKIK